MIKGKITEELIDKYRQKLILEEKSTATVEKYLRDVRAFFAYIGQAVLTKELVMAYKQFLVEKQYAIRSINSMIVSINSLLEYLDCGDCKVKAIK